MHPSTVVFFVVNALLLVSIFCVPFWGFHTFLDRRNLTYSDHVGGILAYFLAWSLLDLWLFRWVLAKLPTDSDVILPTLILSFTLLFAVGMYAIGKIALPDVTPYLGRYGSASQEFVQLNLRYLAAKSCDVAYQQLGLVLGVLLLSTVVGSPLLLSFLIACLFGMAHVALYTVRYRQHRVPKANALLFSIASFIAGGVMPILILLVPFGWVYSFCLHELYYPLAGVSLRYRLVKQEQAATKARNHA
jgi:hypothetical protein